MTPNAFLLTAAGSTLVNQQVTDTWLCDEPADPSTCARVASPRWEASGGRWTLTGRAGEQRVIVLAVDWTSSSTGLAIWGGRRAAVEVKTLRDAAPAPRNGVRLSGWGGWTVSPGNVVAYNGHLEPGFWASADDCVPPAGDLAFFVPLDLTPSATDRPEPPVVYERGGDVTIAPAGPPGSSPRRCHPGKRAVFQPARSP